MNSYLSLKGVKIALQKWSQSDPNIKAYGFGQIYDINGQPKTEQLYPQMWVSPQQSQPVLTANGMHVVNRSMQILFFDTKLADNTNELQVISDSEELAFRFIRWLMNSNDPEINLLQNPTITPFTDKFLDDVAGVMVDFIVEFNGSNDYCSDPNSSTSINFQ